MAKTDWEKMEKIFSEDPKHFEAIIKHYHDLFSYHANQRLTTFNFFIVSLSFLTSAYAILLSRGDSQNPLYSVACAISLATYFLIIGFSRLDARNEQIIQINEQPLKILQKFISRKMGESFWESFTKSEKSSPMTTFGTILPLIYTLTASIAWSGLIYSIVNVIPIEEKCGIIPIFLLWSGGIVLAVIMICSNRPVRLVDIWSE